MSSLSKLEKLQQETADKDIQLLTAALPARIKGLYYASNDGVSPMIALNNSIATESEKACVLGEELGHYYTTSANLLNIESDRLLIIKQENQARRWAAKKLIALADIIQAFEYGVQNSYELAEYLGITESFLAWSIDYYKKIYGLFVTVDGVYTIYFEPFGVLKHLNK